MKTTMTVESFAALIREYNIKFTTPQQAIVDQVLQGHKLVTVNQHHMSGGQIYWMRKGASDPSYAGHIYKAYVHMTWSVEKQTGLDIDWSFMWDLRRDLVGNF